MPRVAVAVILVPSSTATTPDLDQTAARAERQHLAESLVIAAP